VVAARRGAKVIRMPENRGPAAARNAGAAVARGNALAFTDSDCRPTPPWTAAIARRLGNSTEDAIMGRVVLGPSSRLGNAISALGFPAGGSVGFEKIWKVDRRGYTTSLSTCNCAVRRSVFTQLGGFDTGFPYAGGEDSLLAHHLVRAGFRIRYSPDVVIHHAARDRLGDFARWQYKRGKSSYIFFRKVSGQGRFVRLRGWSVKNVLHQAWKDRRLTGILGLMVMGYTAQAMGFMAAGIDRDINARIDHQSAVAG
jgi:GT2 family glycosyltransferase